MRKLSTHRTLLSVFLLSMAFLTATTRSFCSPNPENPSDKISQLLWQLASAPPDTCGGPWSPNLDADQFEQSILEETAKVTLERLNRSGPELNAASNRVTEALNQIKAQSEKVNAAWPEESRFRFELLPIRLALVLKVGI